MAILHGDIALRDNTIFGKGGDLANGEVPEQHVGAILNANSGNFRRTPTLGANIERDIDGPVDSRGIAAKVQNSLFLDGWRADDLEINTPDLETLEVTVTSSVKTTDNTQSLI